MFTDFKEQVNFVQWQVSPISCFRTECMNGAFDDPTTALLLGLEPQDKNFFAGMEYEENR